MFSRIAGTGHYLPEQCLTNAMLEQRVDTTHDWIVERTGIHQRHIASNGENAVTMGVAAARNALAAADLETSDIDLIVVATTSGDRAFPSVACEIQAALTEHNIPAFDVAAACSGFLFAMSVADQYIRSGTYRNVLIIGTDVLSRLCRPDDRNTIILFGDGAGAAVLQASDTPGIESTHLHSAGEFADLLGVNHPPRGSEAPAEELSEAWMYMKGNEVFKVAVSKLSELVNETLVANNLTPDALDWLVPHQANLRIIKATAKKLKMPMSQVITTLADTGNTSAASVPIALDVAIRDGRIKRGQRLLLEAFGGGFAWGSALVTY
ncbi:beta-ketoacyl-ACP synthase III [Pseudidiomarina terrestris]|uniref:Beta-ketoacyl-[acyl-carrier-protein] synthase III n=1 Tax=Pseudidiomarina terrestris TaxID=2820060 RepID=A0AAW7QTR6_9GAMM|nr:MULTISPECIES: beta-ketoacyl-ACP synthase III [unclassified Pseudidiomarina]MDN7123635.1 ketoacyl-ACP synthase III [Pseudidiomarina sp. 1APP75-32.1]MDN7126575.1 ketoacyl-ACP synthase III [Pseudidiomarina sp. 1APR75-33.1]MDN7128641.1 ketoacyl-ACP synthase III [Pseudidiomarina sp. 1APR75-15]MDN7135100.1 ketoacyl-ACP synthase III [Pseudidiomarina sp. 1ASP75-5]MDN7137771.1 ketoacyl-ACP synthase III [Pseudidiomarina sp. 1ASP75-14]